MTRTFFAGGFFYNPRTDKVLLQKLRQAMPQQTVTWTFFGGDSKRGETPEKALQRIIKETIRQRITLKAMQRLYEYQNEDTKKLHIIFSLIASSLPNKKKLEANQEFQWTPLRNVLKLELPQNIRQDLTFFQREMNAKKAARSSSSLRKLASFAMS